MKAQALDMYFNKVGVRKVARFVGASPAAVIIWIRRARVVMRRQLQQAADALTVDLAPDVIEMGEIYTYVPKRLPGRHMDCL